MNMRTLPALLLVLLAAAFAACGGGDDNTSSPTPAASNASTATAGSSPSSAATHTPTPKASATKTPTATPKRSGTPTPTESGSASTGIDACTLASASDIENAIGGSWQSGSGGDICIYNADDGSSAVITTSDLGSDAETVFDNSATVLGDHDVTDVGDAAYWTEDFGGLAVRHGHIELDVALSDGDGNLLEDESIAVAKIAVENLP